MAFIEVSNLTKDYKITEKKKGFWGAVSSLFIPEYSYKRAVDDINFTIEAGEMVGFIGPNGAGKSTTVKMLTGILVPTSGSITIGGLSPYKDRKKNAARIGVVFGQRTQLWWDLPVSDTFEILKYIYKIPDGVYRRNMELFNDLLGLPEFFRMPVRQLSLGQRMRADIAASLVHNPEVVLFDEPTIGLDVVAKENIREFIRHMNKEAGITMLFTTHDMIDIEKTCQRMLIIDKGVIIYDGSVEGIKKRFGKSRTLLVEFSEKYSNISLPSGVELIEEQENKKWFRFSKDEVQVSSLIAKLTQEYNIVDLMVREPEIEGIIREIYQKGIDYDKTTMNQNKKTGE